MSSTHKDRMSFLNKILNTIESAKENNRVAYLRANYDVEQEAKELDKLEKDLDSCIYLKQSYMNDTDQYKILCDAEKETLNNLVRQRNVLHQAEKYRDSFSLGQDKMKKDYLTVMQMMKREKEK